MTAIPLARQLRDGTRRAHHLLDHHPLLQQLIIPGLSRTAYARSLLAIHRPHGRLEACVLAGAQQLDITLSEEIKVSSRTHRLETDLEALGVVPPCVLPSALPVAVTPAVLAGQCYVLEGSRLGGQVIARQVQRALGAKVPVSYFDSPQPEVHWRRFLTFLDENCRPDEAPVVVAAAQQAFDDYLSALSEAEPSRGWPPSGDGVSLVR
ncbi:biliverdin-producing heme oxygenase [Litchfieldella xinjiangensis]|uniref:biliverdin-producing heme oxygenase n=1 Tax=Litchfieldella xinjiangensis TaxID=1166948 RepID=UPI000694168A|nr:biliverdin-producing heme oxygenase [Halomonas xinjiangensis]